MPALMARRARHVISEHGRTLDFVRALESADWCAAGARMRESHASLRDDFEVSCWELDLLVALSEEIPGIHGCRMTGGGFGGCVVALTEAAHAVSVGRQLSNKYHSSTGIDPVWFLTHAASGASVES
jgi:galactokinase